MSPVYKLRKPDYLFRIAVSPLPHRKDLADALQEEHAVRAEAVERARREQMRSKRPLWALFLDGGLCSEDQLFRVLQRRGGASAVPEERLGGMLVPAGLRSVLPRNLAGDLGVLPLERSADGRRVALGMVDPLMDISALRTALSRVGVVEIHRYLIHPALLRRYLGPLYADTTRAPLAADAPSPPEDLPLSDRPTGLVTLPEHAAPLRPHKAPRPDEKTGRLGDRPPQRPAQRHKQDGSPAHLPVITQPMVPLASPAPDRPATVQIDPQLQAEIERLGGDRPRSRRATPATYQELGEELARRLRDQGLSEKTIETVVRTLGEIALAQARSNEPTDPDRTRVLTLPGEIAEIDPEQLHIEEN